MTQNEAILAVLADDNWHTCADIHRRAGFSRLNSRVAELRTRGYTIECRHVDGATRGPEAYEYFLAGTPGEQVPQADTLTAFSSVSAVSPERPTCSPDAPSTAQPAGARDSEASTYEQLRLVA